MIINKGLKNIIISTYKSPVGELLIGSYGDKICLCDWKYRKQRKQIDQRIMTSCNAEMIEGETSIISETITQLEAYFSGKSEIFDIPLLFNGTRFQTKVWKHLTDIPFGKTMSYLDLSQNIGDKKAIRAVAAANGANAISILVPCHRIIGTDGKLVGYAGGLKAKEQLLRLEGAEIFNQTRLF